MDSVHNMRYYAVTSITQWQNHASGTMAKPKSLYTTAPEPLCKCIYVFHINKYAKVTKLNESKICSHCLIAPSH